MILLLHIAIALASMIYTGYVFFSPSRAKLRGSYALVALTIASGTYLVVDKPSHMVQACATGLVYLGVIFAGIVAVRLKLARTASE
jgi:hypothetical protein